MASSWQPVPGGVTAPQGFLASGIVAGLKPSGKPDLALLLAPVSSLTIAFYAVVQSALASLKGEGGKASKGSVEQRG